MEIYDLKTLEVVHEYYEVEARTEAQFDSWLNEQILRAKYKRDLTPEERHIFLAPENTNQETRNPEEFLYSLTLEDRTPKVELVNKESRRTQQAK